MKSEPPYAPFYCEENAWRLGLQAEEREIDDPHVVFLSGERRAVALWSQRVARDPELPTVWDYHVVLAGRRTGGWKIFDADCVAGFDLPYAAWIAASFPFRGAVPPELEPRFKVVGFDEFEREFASDRSHMRDEDGTWKQPPPPWPPKSASTSNLWEWVDGVDLDLESFEGWLERAEAGDG